MTKIYLLVGTPGSGKTWVASQLTDKFEWVAHDAYNGKGFAYEGMAYVNEIMKASRTQSKPVLAETPFSVSQIIEPLEKKGFTVEPVFIIESDHTTSTRYLRRENKPIPQGHLTRIQTYRKRAKEMNAFSGTSAQVLEYLKGV